ncbi:Na+/H+ antiporter subunit A [Actinotalea sp. M2MS4P-6]|uniref:Na+/H+ antiporter subunit A n=1 Tax=Actinotalea sp. M2MS4P-6 TaxID=2983762 RepID=UPI0021E36C43|nr:Na+/H+ antiporter subunit A [Actinotalea sp. M2MS4P-6]MCV2392988.1 Na+/H+ antiporter subunit A [Actinotalea sp. M2MS4P-6]
MLFLLGLHLVAALAAPLAVRRMGRNAFLVLAAAPAAALAWAVANAGGIASGAAPAEQLAWVPHLGLDIETRVDTLSWLMVVLISGVGVAVLVYSSRYFAADASGLGRFAGLLVAFAGSMLGLVTSDNLLLLYVFWELTTVTSYLLIGHYADRKSSRRAAMQAIIITTTGGLAMLIGILLIGNVTGTYSISAILADPPTGTVITVAVALLLVGAVTKSALVPFHFWLPAAMAAPTPVSAYLHAAAMVKAGVYLVARFAPAFADLPVWQVTVLGLGSTTLLVGGYRALRQYDLKLVLAFGTVSQLGLLVILVGFGTQAVALAGIALLGAHAMFKSALFLTVGVVDAATGTRDLRRLSGIARQLPVTAGAAALAVASMCGVPPFAGYVAKEAAIEALRHDSTTAARVALVAVVLGSVLTVAYGLRFWWGAFGTKRVMPGQVAPAGAGPALPADEPAATVQRRPSVLLVAPAATLAVLGLVAGVLPASGERLLGPYAATLSGEPGHLVLWGGLAGALITLVVLGVGALLFRWRAGVERWQARFVAPVDMDRFYRRSMRRLDELAADVTAATQRGSLPLYLGTILLVMVALADTTLTLGTSLPGVSQIRLWDSPVQVVAGGLAVVAAVLAARSRRRLKAVVLAGASGFGVAMLFLLHGAPDLGLTQVLVETVTLVVFVLVLRRLPPYFSVRPLAGSRWVRMAIGVAVGLTVAVLALVMPAARSFDPVSVDFPTEAYEFGGGKNVVNVTLVDIRAWDTMGEIAVLLVAATGVASLIFLRRRSGDLERPGTHRPGEPLERTVWQVDSDAMAPLRARAKARWEASAAAGGPARQHSEWLAGSRTLHPQRRSVIMEIATRLLFHTMVVVAIYLLFSGHNSPGGGFVAGLVVGIALAVRYLAGGRYELGDAAPVHPGLLLGAGLFLSAGVGLVALLFGQSVLESTIYEVDVPVLGHIKLVTSLFFDIGVFGVVVGLVLDVLRSLGAQIDRHAEGQLDDEPDGPDPDDDGPDGTGPDDDQGAEQADDRAAHPDAGGSASAARPDEAVRR